MKTKPMLTKTILVLVGAGAATLSCSAQTVTNPSYTLSTYHVISPSAITQPGGLAIDPATRTLFRATPNTLLRIAPDHTESDLGIFSVDFYPYIAADIQFLDGNIYMLNSTWNQFTISSSGPPVQVGVGPVLSTAESGVAAVGTTLYGTEGMVSSAGLLNVLDTITTTTYSLPIVGMPDYAGSLEYDPVSGLLFCATNDDSGNASDVQFYSINLATGAATSLGVILPTGTGPAARAYGNFAVDPNGQFLYTRNGTEVDQINVSTGAVTAFVTGLQGDGTEDLIFGPSSTGAGSSLYLTDYFFVYEVQGFAPAPEPGSAVLLLGGGALLALRRRRSPAGV